MASNRHFERRRWLQIFLLLAFVLLGACTANRPTVRVAFDPGWRPLILQGLEPSLTGFSLELMAEIAKHESVQIEALRSSGQNLLYNLEAGAYTAILTTADPTPELRKIFHFSEPVLFTGTSLVARISHPLRSNQELKGLIIGVQSNSKAFSVLSGIPGISFKQYQSPLDALEDLSAGHLDAVAMERLPAITFCRNTFRGELTVLEQPLDLVPAIRLASKRENRFFERLVKGMQKSPVEALQRRWGLAL